MNTSKTKSEIRIKTLFLRFVMCRLFGHRIDRYLIERSKLKTCKRCGEEMIVWDIMTEDEMRREFGDL